MSAVKTNVQDINETRKNVSVNVAAVEIANIQKQLIREFQREAKIPGFRPGKASENIIHMRYAKELKSELSKRVVAKAYQDGVAKLDFEVFNVLESDQGEITPDSDATVTFTVDIVQEFELPEYKGLKVTVGPVEATDQEVDKLLEQILGQRAEFNAVEKAAEKGDYVRCSYEGKIGEELIADRVADAPIWGTQKSTWEEAGTEGSFGVRAVIEGLVGMKAGDSKEVAMDFPEDFDPEALAGKSAVYSLKVEEVREKALPEIDEAFLKSMQVKDEAELRKHLSDSIENQKKQQNMNAERQQVAEQLLKNVDFALPESGIESERNAALLEFMQQNMKKGASEADFEANKEKFHENACKVAPDRLKSRLIIGKIALKENIQATDDDFGQMIMMEAQQSGLKPEKIAKDIQKDQNRLNHMRNEIVFRKTLDFIAENAERHTEVAVAGS